MMQSGEEVAKSAIYVELKKRMLKLNDSGVFEELNRLREASRVYAQIVGVGEHTDPKITRWLARLRRWEIAVANPFILKLLLAVERGAFSATDAAACFKIMRILRRQARRLQRANQSTNRLLKKSLRARREVVRCEIFGR